jgi:Pycsar effector protein
MKEEKKKKIKTDVILKETAANYVRLIGDADRKARIMLVVNSLFLTLSVTLISKIIANVPYSWLFASILMFSNVVSLFFSIQSVKPEFNSEKNEETENNILHYKKCNDLTLEEYRSQINSTLIDDTQKMDAFIKELYFYGRLLNMKYKLLKRAHYFFLWGIVLAVLVYIITLIMFRGQTETYALL